MSLAACNRRRFAFLSPEFIGARGIDDASRVVTGPATRRAENGGQQSAEWRCKRTEENAENKKPREWRGFPETVRNVLHTCKILAETVRFELTEGSPLRQFSRLLV